MRSCSPGVNDGVADRRSEGHVGHRLASAILVGVGDPGNSLGDVKHGAKTRVLHDLDSDAGGLLGHTSILATHSAGNVGAMA